jgi:hypothetical protein
MTPWQRRQRGLNSPRDIANLAAWYDVRDTGSMVIDGSNRVQLIADKSGNSAENVLALNGVAGNGATTPDAAVLDITGDITMVAFVTPDSWNVDRYLISKRADASQISYSFNTTTTGGSRLSARFSSDGLSNGGEVVISSAPVPFAALSAGWVAVTRSGVNVKFWTSTDGSSWTQLGTTQTITNAGNIFVSTSTLRVGANDSNTATFSGLVHRAMVYDGIPAAFGGAGGTLAFDANFSTASKLATSFTESSSNAATVTINTTGDLGARICGARDYVNMTAAAQVGYTASDFSVSGDGTADYARTAPFPLPQAFTRISVIKQDTWTASDVLLDGANGANSGALVQTTTTPQLNINAGSSVADNTGLAVDTWAVVTEVFNGASSSLRIGRGVATTGNAGANAANGLTLFASGASTAAAFAAGSLRAQAVYSRVLTRAERDALIEYFSRRTGVAL